jgi:peptide/nickel transport system permease protein
MILLLSLLLITTRFSLIYESVVLFTKFFLLLFKDFTWAFNQLNLQLADYFFSTITILLLPVLIIIARNKFRLPQLEVSFPSGTITILTFIFIYAPLITDTNPDFQKNIGVTKLLPPLSRVYMLKLKEPDAAADMKTKFLYQKNKVVKRSFDEQIIFADSLKENDSIIYYQKEKEFHIKRELLQEADGKLFEKRVFLFGTDEYGRDVFTRLIFGARISLFVGFGSVAITLIFGLFLGFLAGYFGGIIDSALNRIADMLMAFPIVFLIILILALFGNSLFAVILVLGYSGWMSLFKIVRSEVISIKNRDYFITAQMLGLPKRNLLFKEIMPVIAAPVLVNLIFQYGNVILAESALSYLGLGTGGMYPSWGAMIDSGQQYLTKAWWMIFPPGFALFITLFAANNIARKLSAYYNPLLKS